jgi:hypothetical protein
MSILHVDPEAPPLEVWYLDHDPTNAAAWVADVHAPKALFDAAVLLSNAWWGHPAVTRNYGPFGGEQVGGPYLPENVAGSAWLHGLEIYNFGHRPRTELDHWVQRSAANYTWLWRHAVALSLVCRSYLRRALPAECAVFALEAPPDTLDTSAGATEPPFTRATRRVYVEEDGAEYVDAVASFRKLYRTAPFSPTLCWSGRAQPPWFAL